MTQGGKREGAGRKPRKSPRVKITLAVEPDTAEKFRAIASAAGKSQPAVFAGWVEYFE